MGSNDSEPESETDFDRQAILARRRRFVAAAVTGLTTSTLATACPCLKVAPPDDSTTSTATGQTDGGSGDDTGTSDEATDGSGSGSSSSGGTGESG